MIELITGSDGLAEWASSDQTGKRVDMDMAQYCMYSFHPAGTGPIMVLQHTMGGH